jgi:hypothetical protein
MKPADSTGSRLFGRELNNAPAAPSTFGTISSDRGKGALQFTRLADHNPQHRHLQATGLQVPALAIRIQQNCHRGSVRNASLRNCIHFCEPVGQNLLCQNSVGDPDRSS